jgi:membrane protein DedA with SNARE-associated domain
MENWIIEIMNNYGYLGILSLIAIENIFPPIPSEVILTLGGFMTTTTNLTVLGVVLSATLGAGVGAVILYGVGLLIDVERLEIIIDKWGHILRLKKEDIYRADHWFTKYGEWTVFFCRLVPLLRSLISIPAGMSHMGFLHFLILTILGSLLWNIVLVNIGAVVGASWYEIVKYFDVYSNIVYLVLALLIIIGGIIFFQKRIKK